MDESEVVIFGITADGVLGCWWGFGADCQERILEDLFGAKR